MADIVNEHRKNNQLPADFKKKFAGTPLEDKHYCQEAIYRLAKRIEDKKIQNNFEVKCFIKSDYWDSDILSRLLRAFVQGRFTFDFENFKVVSHGLENSQTPYRGTQLETDNELILGIIREDARVKNGPKLTTFLEEQFQNIKSRVQKDYPFELPDAVVYSWIFEYGIRKIYEDQGE